MYDQVTIVHFTLTVHLLNWFFSSVIAHMNMMIYFSISFDTRLAEMRSIYGPSWPNIVAGDYLQQKGQTLDDYVVFIKVPGHKGNELSVYHLACMMNFKVIVMMITGDWSTVDDCDISLADIVLYLGKSTFRDTVPIPTKTTPIPINDEQNEHEVPKVVNPNC